MYTKIVNRPILFSLMIAFLLCASYLLITFCIQYLLVNVLGLNIHCGDNHIHYLYIRAVNRLCFSILTIVLLGVIIKSNGFKYAFRLEGFRKGLIAMVPVLLFIIARLSSVFIIYETTEPNMRLRKKPPLQTANVS